MSEKYLILNPRGCGDIECPGCYPALALAILCNEVAIVDEPPTLAEPAPEPTHEAPERKQ